MKGEGGFLHTGVKPQAVETLYQTPDGMGEKFLNSVIDVESSGQQHPISL